MKGFNPRCQIKKPAFLAQALRNYRMKNLAGPVSRSTHGFLGRAIQRHRLNFLAGGRVIIIDGLLQCKLRYGKTYTFGLCWLLRAFCQSQPQAL